MAAKRLNFVISVAIITIGSWLVAEVANDWWRLRHKRAEEQRQRGEEQRRENAAMKITAVMLGYKARLTLWRRRLQVSIATCARRERRTLMVRIFKGEV